MIDNIDWTKSDLIPAIVQELDSGKVLMLAYMNKEAVELTLSTKLAHFYSRSRKKDVEKKVKAVETCNMLKRFILIVI